MAALLLLPAIGGAWEASILLLGGLLLGAVSAVRARGADPPVEALIKAMTLDEKCALLHGAEDPAGRAETGYVAGVPRLGVPPLRITDSRGAASATALPAPISLGASFSPSLARRVGTTQGRESRDRGQNVVLAPNTDLLRVPQARGAAESMGEDPFLIGRLAAEQVKGLQKEGAIATVELAPGETATVCRRLGRRAFSYWSEADDRWRVAAGARPILVGASARRVRLEDTAHVD